MNCHGPPPDNERPVKFPPPVEAEIVIEVVGCAGTLVATKFPNKDLTKYVVFNVRPEIEPEVRTIGWFVLRLTDGLDVKLRFVPLIAIEDTVRIVPEELYGAEDIPEILKVPPLKKSI